MQTGYRKSLMDLIKSTAGKGICKLNQLVIPLSCVVNIEKLAAQLSTGALAQLDSQGDFDAVSCLLNQNRAAMGGCSGAHKHHPQTNSLPPVMNSGGAQECGKQLFRGAWGAICFHHQEPRFNP